MRFYRSPARTQRYFSGLGAPYESVLECTMVYADGSERDFSEDSRTIYTSTDDVFAISGNVATLEEGALCEDTITVEFKYYTTETAETTLKGDAMAQIVVSPIAYPCVQENTEDCDARPVVYQVGGIFQQLDIVIAAESERELRYTADDMLLASQVSVDCEFLAATGGDCSGTDCDSDECVIADEPLSEFFLQGVAVGDTTVTVYWDVYVGTFDVTISDDASDVIDIEILEVCDSNGTACYNVNETDTVMLSGIVGSTFYVSSRITFEDNSSWIDSEQKDFNLASTYLAMVTSDEALVKLNTSAANAELELLDNAAGATHVKITVSAGTVSDHVFVIPNLMPDVNDVDLGRQDDFPWADLAEAAVGDQIDVPVYYNSNNTVLTAFEIVVIFDPTILKAVKVTGGDDWDASVSFTVADPLDEVLLVSAEPTSTTGGTNLEVAVITFEVLDDGTFDADTVIVETRTEGDAFVGLCDRHAIAGATRAVSEASRGRGRGLSAAASSSSSSQWTRRRRNLGTLGAACEWECDELPVGDANGDCRFSVGDLSFMKRYTGTGVDKPDFDFDEDAQLVVMDADLNGLIDGVDVSFLDRVLTHKYRFLRDFPNVTVGMCDVTITASYLDATNNFTTGAGENMYIEVGTEKNVDNAVVLVGNDDFGVVQTDAGFAVLMDVDEDTGVYAAKLSFPDKNKDLSEQLEFAIMMETFSEAGSTSLQRLYPFYGSSWQPFAAVGYEFVSMPIYAPQYAGGTTVDTFDFGCTCDGACFSTAGYYKAGCYDDDVDDECVKCEDYPKNDEGPALYFTDSGYLEDACPYTECDPAPDGYYYTQYIFYSSTCESKECPACPVGEWNSGCNQTVNGSFCEQCTLPPEGHYWVTGGDTHFVDDCPTAACDQDCPVGEYNLGCNGTTSAGECTPCTDPPDGHHYTGDGNLTDSCPTAACDVDCPIGQWNEGCNQTTSPGECVVCTEPPQGYYWTTDGDLLDACETAMCSLDCPRGMYNKGCDQTATNGTCVDCSEPPPGYFITDDGNLTDACPEEECFTDCPVGEWNEGCSGTTSNGTCVQCSTPPEGYYWTGDGDYTDECQETECPVCDTVGEWNKGCDRTTSAGECVSCIAYEGHYWTSVGTYEGEDSCEHKACNVDCPVGQWNKGCNGTNYKGDCVKCTAPPEGYYYVDDGNYTDSCAVEACPTDCPIGEWRSGCDQTTSNGTCVACTDPPEGYYWVSDGNFTDSCEVLPCKTDCPVGQYNEHCNGTDTSGECVACSDPPEGFFFVGDGEYSDACEVEPCATDCDIGYYNKGCDGTSNAGACTLCTLPPLNHYFVTDGDLTDSCVVESCTSACPAGQWADGCGGTSAGACTACSDPPEGEYFTGMGAFEDNCPTAECEPDRCAAGFFLDGCDGTTSPGECANCTAAPAGYYYSSNGGLEDACGTKKCDITCPIGQWRAGCDQTTEAGECVPCTASDGDYYFFSNGLLADACVEKDCDPDTCEGPMFLDGCGGTDAGECVACSDPPPGYYFTMENGGFEDACPVAQCAENCAVGQFRVGCGGTSAGECTDCTDCPPTAYFVSDGGLRDACDVAPCATCPTGEYNTGCENLFTDGECMECTNAPPGTYFLPHVFTEDATGRYLNGGQANACPYKACPTDCDFGKYTYGCEGTTSPGVCAACTNEMMPCLDNGAGDLFAYMDSSDAADVAKLACESHYGKGKCVDGVCGGFRFYHSRPVEDACVCDSPVGEYEFVYENHFEDQSVNADCGTLAADDEDDALYLAGGAQMFVRKKVADRCDGSSWEVTLLDLGAITDAAALDPDFSCQDFYWKGNGGLEDACPFEMCEIACPVGQYRDGCGGTNKGSCVDCTEPAGGAFFVGDGNLADACPTATCVDTCPGGFRLVGCTDSEPGVCTPDACNDTATGYKFNESGTGCDAVQPCMDSCNASYYLSGECGNFEDYGCSLCKTWQDCPPGFGILEPCDGTTYADAECVSLECVTYSCMGDECGVGKAVDVGVAHYSFSVVLAGENMDVNGTNSFAADGRFVEFNSSADAAYVGGGNNHTMRGDRGSIVGGSFHLADAGVAASIMGGYENRVAGENNIVVGGYRNDVCNWDNGELVKCGDEAVSASGFNNDSPGSFSTMGGGYGNTAVNDWISIQAGRRNRATSNYAMVGGGYLNKVVGRYGVTLGGSRNTATGKFSVSFGWYTRAGSTRAAVFSFSGDGKNRVCRSLGENTMNTCTKNGYYINDLNLETLVQNQRRRALSALGAQDADDGGGAQVVASGSRDVDDEFATEPRYAPPPYDVHEAARALAARADRHAALLAERRARLAALKDQVARLRAYQAQAMRDEPAAAAK